MCPQIACPRRCKVTLVAFVWLFSTVHFHVFPQMACLKGCKVTLVTFVWLFPTVHVHVFLQIACLRGCKVTLVAFVLLLGNLRMQLWKLSKLTTNGTKKEKRRKMKNFQKILGWNTRLIPYRKIPVYRDFAKIPYRTVPEWNSSYRWGLPSSRATPLLGMHSLVAGGWAAQASRWVSGAGGLSSSPTGQ